MKSFPEAVNQYRKQLKNGAIQQAYRGVMKYIMGLRTHFTKKYPAYAVSGSIYYGYMDMTYFSVFPKSIIDRKLKIAIVFLHEAFRFEVWLSVWTNIRIDLLLIYPALLLNTLILFVAFIQLLIFIRKKS